MIKFLTGCAILWLATTSLVQAHPLWILPHEFTVSSDGSEWITFDVTASNTLFNFDHSIPLEAVRVHAPDGSQHAIGQYFKGHHRSVFDWQLTQNGTYRISLQRPPFFFTSYKTADNHKPKRLMANKQQAADKLPADAQDVKTLHIYLSSHTYITHNTPSEQVLSLTGQGLELKPLTHPNDIVQHEEVEWQLYLDGEPAPKRAVELTAGGTQYRNKRAALQLTTDENGVFRFTPTQAGAWLFFAGFNQPTETPLADVKRHMLFVTFEVMLE